MPSEMRWTTPPEVARRLGVNCDKVRGWIRAGELKATNVGDQSRPLWRICPAELRAFLNRRSNSAEAADDV